MAFREGRELTERGKKLIAETEDRNHILFQPEFCKKSLITFKTLSGCVNAHAFGTVKNTQPLAVIRMHVGDKHISESIKRDVHLIKPAFKSGQSEAGINQQAGFSVIECIAVAAASGCEDRIFCHEFSSRNCALKPSATFPLQRSIGVMKSSLFSSSSCAAS